MWKPAFTAVFLVLPLGCLLEVSCICWLCCVINLASTFQHALRFLHKWNPIDFERTTRIVHELKHMHKHFRFGAFKYKFFGRGTLVKTITTEVLIFVVVFKAQILLPIMCLDGTYPSKLHF